MSSALAQRLQKLRQQRGWTQAAAAEKIQIQQSYLSKLENGRYLPSPTVLQQIAEAYQVPLAELQPELLINTAPLGNQPSHSWSILLLLLLAGCLFASGRLALWYPEQFYTYQAESNQAIYRVTPKYLGEKFSEQGKHGVSHYRLIGERKVSRPENNWLQSCGLLLLPFAAFAGWWQQRKRSQATQSKV